ncbi:hypothetical protein BH24ACT15_BH24ACT15_00670 [soil metagenome]
MSGAGRPRSPGSSSAIDGDLKGLADLAHACSAERADPLNKHLTRHLLHRVEVDGAVTADGVVVRLQYDFAGQTPGSLGTYAWMRAHLHIMGGRPASGPAGVCRQARNWADLHIIREGRRGAPVTQRHGAATPPPGAGRSPGRWPACHARVGRLR